MLDVEATASAIERDRTGLDAFDGDMPERPQARRRRRQGIQDGFVRDGGHDRLSRVVMLSQVLIPVRKDCVPVFKSSGSSSESSVSHCSYADIATPSRR